MIHPYRIALFASFVLNVEFAIHAQDAPRQDGLSQAEKQSLHERIREILEKHRDVPIDRESPEYGLFAIVGEAAKSDRAFVDELINLTVIRDVPGDTTEKFSPAGFSPAGRQLQIIGSGVTEVIKTHLNSGRLSTWQSWVLSDILRTFQLMDQGPDGVTIPAIILDSYGELWPTFAPSAPTTQPALVQPPIVAVPGAPLTEKSETEPNLSSKSNEFTLAVILVISAILLWLLIKRHRHSYRGT